MSEESANVVEGVLKKIYAGEPPYAKADCGFAGPMGSQVAVALMRRMYRTGDAAEYAEKFARSLHDAWGVGDAACDNGVVMLLSVNDRQLYISTGAGTVRRLSFNVLGDIIEDARPALRDGRYDDAVERTVVNIGMALAGRPVEPEASKSSGWDDLIAISVFGVTVGGMALWAARSERGKRRRYQDCKSKLEKLKRDQASMRGSTYNPTSCPVCLEDFTDVDGSAAGGGGGGGEPGPSGSSGGPAAGGEGASGSGGCCGGGAHHAHEHSAAAAVVTAAGSSGAVGVPAAGSSVPLVEVGSGSLKHETEEQELRRPLMSPGGDSASAGVGAAAAAVAGAAAAAGGAAGAAPPALRRPLVLPCGHAFCEPCISAWLDQKKVTCPICRRPIDEDDAPAPADPTAQRPQQRPTDPRDGRSDADAGGGSGGGPSGSSGPRPPCIVDDDDYDTGLHSSGMGMGMGMGMGNGMGFSTSTANNIAGGGLHGAVPRLRLRWGARRRGGFGFRMQEDMLMAEMLFRLRQLQRQHPQYISTGMMQAWEQDLQNGREFNSQQLRDFQLSDPATRSQLAASGSSGSHVRFGGGSSRGGGGRGSSW